VIRCQDDTPRAGVRMAYAVTGVPGYLAGFNHRTRGVAEEVETMPGAVADHAVRNVHASAVHTDIGAISSAQAAILDRRVAESQQRRMVGISLETDALPRTGRLVHAGEVDWLFGRPIG